MLSLYVYHSETEKGKILHSRCLDSVRENRITMLDGGLYSDEERFGLLCAELDGSSLFVIKTCESTETLSEFIGGVTGNNYTVLILSRYEEMLTAVTPSLRPAGVLLESSDDHAVGRVLCAVYADYERYVRSLGSTEYRFRIKGEDFSESFENIYLIEVQSKRITFHTRAQSYEFYDSLEAVMKKAPDSFLRIHRSYVINTNFIRNINFRDKVIILDDDSEIFFSRNYAAELKEFYYSQTGEGANV